MMQMTLFSRQGIQKVAKMLQDQERTRFVVVCIAEYLSICETRRLLQELKKVSWIIKECINTRRTVSAVRRLMFHICFFSVKLPPVTLL